MSQEIRSNRRNGRSQTTPISARNTGLIAINRLEQIKFFYELIEELEDKLGGKRCLKDCHGKMEWPQRGVYFFFENGEKRSSGLGLRVVRVGTHALKTNSKTTLWNRLRTHRGTTGGRRVGGGNHRGSIFRLHIGTSILRKRNLESCFSTWGVGSSASRSVRDGEAKVEKIVSRYIGEMPFLWLAVNDAPGPKSERSYIERNSITLLSNYRKINTKMAIDPLSKEWLGQYCRNRRVRRSGLWNDEYVREQRLDPDFLDKLGLMVRTL